MESVRPTLLEFKCENGLKAYILDESRPIAGDRWQIQVRLEVSVPVRGEYFSECSNPREAYLEFVAEFGPTVKFEQAKVRNFIGPDMKEELIQTMTRELTESVVVYLGKPGFPSRFVMSRYREWKDTEAWRIVHERMMRQEGEIERER